MSDTMNLPLPLSEDGMLHNPLTGEQTGPPTTDNLIAAYERYDQIEKRARLARQQITMALAAMSPRTDDCRTTRVRGTERKVKIEWPQSCWNQTLLKYAWHDYPQFRDEYLAISSLRVSLREYKKLAHEQGTEEFENFKQLLKAADLGPQGSPRIVIED